MAPGCALWHACRQASVVQLPKQAESARQAASLAHAQKTAGHAVETQSVQASPKPGQIMPPSAPLLVVLLLVALVVLAAALLLVTAPPVPVVVVLAGPLLVGPVAPPPPVPGKAPPCAEPVDALALVSAPALPVAVEVTLTLPPQVTTTRGTATRERATRGRCGFTGWDYPRSPRGHRVFLGRGDVPSRSRARYSSVTLPEPKRLVTHMLTPSNASAPGPSRPKVES